MKLLVALLVVLLGSANASAQRVSDPPTVEHAIDLYQDAIAAAANDADAARALFAEAAAVFDEIEATRSFNAEFYRAQGNAHFFAGDPGRAVLSYRRGLERSPGDRRLTASLRAARGSVRTMLEPSRSATLPDTLAQWRLWVPARAGIAVFAVSWTAFWSVLIIGRLRRVSVRPMIVAGLAAASLVSGVALAADAWARHDHAAAVVIAEVEAFNGPSRAIYEPTFEGSLAPGVEARILETRLGWVRLRLRSGAETWVPEEAVERVRPER